MEEMFVQEFNPDSKDWKNLDAFISKLNNGTFLFLDVYAKTALGASMNFYIGNINYMAMIKKSRDDFGFAEDLKIFDHLIHVDIRVHKTKTFFSKKRYAVYISLISNPKADPKNKGVNCVLDELQESFQGIEMNLKIIAKKYFKCKLPLTKKNIAEIFEATTCRIK